jgi:hypothetical protein
MALTDKLRDLDQRLLPGTREQDEDAESYLRRVASSRAITPAQAGDVMAALRVYFDVAPGDGDESSDEDADGEEAGGESDEDEDAKDKDAEDEDAKDEDAEDKGAKDEAGSDEKEDEKDDED